MSAATAAVIGGGIAAVGTVGASLIGAHAAGSAADAQAQATEDSIAAQERMTDKSIAAQKDNATLAANLLKEQAGIAREDLAPFRQIQLKALQDAASLTDPNAQLYQDERRINTEAIQRQLAAQGLLRSKDQTDLLSNLEVSLNQQRFDRVNQLAGIGAVQQSAGISQNLGSGLAGLYGQLSGGLGSTFQQAGQTLGSTLMAGGQAAAQGIIGQANAFAGGLTGIGNAAQGTIGNFLSINNQQNQLALLNKLMAGGGGGIGGYTLPATLGMGTVA